MTDKPTASYETVKFFHAIAGLPAPPPEPELGDLDEYLTTAIQAVTKGTRR
jgi:hypothetical protein